MKKVILFSLLFSLLLSTTCFAIGVDWNSNTISAIGIGAAPEYAIKPGQADALARRAAVVDAYRNLASIVYGVEIENHTTVAELAVKKDTIKTSVSGVIRNARIVDEEQLDNGNYQITLTMPLFGTNSLATAVWPKEENETTTSPMNNDTLLPVPLPPKNEKNAVGMVTGVVIDCRGLGLERAMAPNIVDVTGRTIYNSKDVDNSTIVKNGLASYAKTDDPNDLAAAGSNPLIIKAMAVKDLNKNPVISKEDGDRIVAANKENHFFKSCSVVFIE